MVRITNKDIERRVARLQKEGMDVALDSQYGRFRVTTKQGNRDLSMRGTNREIWDWLEAFELGWQQHAKTWGRVAQSMIDNGEVHSFAGDIVEALAKEEIWVQS